MNERELSKLTYLAFSLVSAPKLHQKILELPSDFELLPMSNDMEQVVNCWKFLYESKNGKVSIEDAKNLIIEGEKNKDKIMIRAGLSLEWAFKNEN